NPYSNQTMVSEFIVRFFQVAANSANDLSFSKGRIVFDDDHRNSANEDSLLHCLWSVSRLFDSQSELSILDTDSAASRLERIFYVLLNRERRAVRPEHQELNDVFGLASKGSSFLSRGARRFHIAQAFSSNRCTPFPH